MLKKVKSINNKFFNLFTKMPVEVSLIILFGIIFILINDNFFEIINAISNFLFNTYVYNFVVTKLIVYIIFIPLVIAIIIELVNKIRKKQFKDNLIILKIVENKKTNNILKTIYNKIFVSMPVEVAIILLVLIPYSLFLNDFFNPLGNLLLLHTTIDSFNFGFIIVIQYIIFIPLFIIIFIELINKIRKKQIKENIYINKIFKYKKILLKIIAIILIWMLTIIIIDMMTSVEVHFTTIPTFLYTPLIAILLYFCGFIYFIKYSIQNEEVENCISLIASGRMDISEKKLSKRNKNIVKQLKEISIELQKSIDEQIKSERLKTEIIANVSHDLRTPLTSIINYTDLLKKEKIKNEKIKNYISIIDEKSQKLKHLTDDLIDVSKITTGNESINKEELNFSELVMQFNGEYSLKFEEKNLKIISKISEPNMMISIDGNKMSRVLENVYMNIYKYALENTRVYVELFKDEKIQFCIKNIAKEQLNISPDELMERFIRGDKARTTEGNGLGLSIAKSLVELHGGTFNIYIEGDLFKVKITL